MYPSHTYLSSPDLFQSKRPSGQDLYRALLDKLNHFGPVQATMQTIYISLENRKRFATALIREHSIKLVLRTRSKISSPRIRNREQLTANSYDHTLLISSDKEIDSELMEWLREAYQDNQ